MHIVANDKDKTKSFYDRTLVHGVYISHLIHLLITWYFHSLTGDKCSSLFNTLIAFPLAIYPARGLPNLI